MFKKRSKSYKKGLKRSEKRWKPLKFFKGLKNIFDGHKTLRIEKLSNWLPWEISRTFSCLFFFQGPFPVYRREDNRRIYLAHSGGGGGGGGGASSHPWSLAFEPSSSPGDGRGSLRLGPGSLTRPQGFGSMVYFERRGKGRWRRAEGTVKCVQWGGEDEDRESWNRRN